MSTHRKRFFWMRGYYLIWSLPAYTCKLNKDKLGSNHTILSNAFVKRSKNRRNTHDLFWNDTSCFHFSPVWCLSFCSCPSLCFILCFYISFMFFTVSYCILAHAKWISGWCPQKRFTKLPLWEMAASRCEYNASAATSVFKFLETCGFHFGKFYMSVQKMWYILYFCSSIKVVVLTYLQPKIKWKCSDYVRICSALLKSAAHQRAIYTHDRVKVSHSLILW